MKGRKESLCRIVIEGDNVHGVGYRPFLLQTARRFRLPKFEAENLEEDSPKVAVLAGGEAGPVSRFIEAVKTRHPREAKVRRVHVDPNPPKSVLPIDEYDKILSSEQQCKMISTGLEMVKNQGQTNEGINRMDEKLTQTNEGIQKLDRNLSLTNEGIKHMDVHVTDRFDRMDLKYDKMSDRMEKIDKTLERLADALIKIAENKN